MKKKTLSLALALVMCLGLAVQTAAAQPVADQVYSAMIAMKDQYPEGTPWTNDNFYSWNGGIYSGGGGCAGFAFMLSDAAFGTLPARMLTSFSYDDIRVGDILRINNDTHSVIVLEVHSDHVILAEGNYNNSVHWGRKLSKSAVLQADYLLTRYTEATSQPSEPGSSNSGKTVVSEKNGYTLTFHNLLRTETLTFNVGHYDLDTNEYVSTPEQLTIYVVEDNSPITFTVIPGRGYDFSKDGPWNWTSDDLGWDAYMKKLEKYAYMYGPQYSWRRGENFLREMEFGNDPVPVDEIYDNPFDLTVKPTDETGSAGYGSVAWLDGMYGVLYTCESDYEKMLAAVAQEPEEPTDPEPTTPPASPATASPTNDSLTADGVLQNPTVYKINGSNYFKIRDLAAILNGSGKQFSVGYDGTLKSVTATTGQGYAKQAGDLAGAPAGGQKTAEPSNDAIYINGEKVEAEVYKIDGSNYFKLRDLGKALNFYVGYSAETGVFIETDKPYAQ